MIVTILLLAGLGQELWVTAKFNPTPLPKAMEIISAASGMKLRASPSLKDEVLLARVNHAPADVLLKHIAESLHAKWESQPDGTLELKPDAIAVRRFKAELAEVDQKTIADSFEYLRRRLAEQPNELDRAAVARYQQKLAQEEARRKAAVQAEDWSRAFVASTAVEEEPSWRAAARLLPLIGAKFLLQMPHDDREVFAEQPTAMQARYPLGTGPVLAQYRRELLLLKPEIDVARTRLILTKWETTAAVNVQFEACDAAGKVVDRAFVRMNGDSDALKTPYSVRSKIEPKLGEEPVQLPKEVEDCRLAMATDDKADRLARLAALKTWRPRLVDPVTYEPTANFQGADLVAAAEAADRNLVGTVLDVTGAMYRQDGPALTATQILRRNASIVREQSDGWLVVSSNEDRQRVSRYKARALLQDAARRGGTSVASAAAWVAESPDKWPFVSWVGDHLSTLLTHGGRYSSSATTIDDESLRLWAALGSGTMRALQDGKSFKLSDMPAAAIRQVSKLVYWYGAAQEEGVEPTEQFPNGIHDGTISMFVSDKPIFIAWMASEGPPATRTPLDAQMLGTFMAKGNKYLGITPDNFKGLDQYEMGLHRTYKLHFDLQPGHHPMDIEFGETFFDPAGKPQARLSESLAAQVEKARLEAIQKLDKNQEGGVIPPQ